MNRAASFAKGAVSRVAGFMAAAEAVIAVSSAVENHRAPSSRHLRTLGFDPKDFPRY
ncbi:MAG TPA: hypothetical protein VGN80_14390 [Devosiaceae bacterium]|jgi:hypothetical protein|nr:hypothetical protein [Devosiaceae bacterium]